MNVDYTALINTYYDVLTEASAPATLQFGKYKLIKAPQSAVTEAPFEQACQDKLISGQLKLFLTSMQDIGFKFTHAYRVENTGYTSNKPDFVVLGIDPDGKPFAYSKKANVTADAFLYYEDSKHFANQIFEKFAEQSRHKPFSEATLLNKWVIGNWDINENNGEVNVHGDLDMSPFRVGYQVADFTELPIKFNYVSGRVFCTLNKITTLTNFPKRILYDLKLTNMHSLENLNGWGCKQISKLHISGCNKMTSLAGIPPVISDELIISECSHITDITDIKKIRGNLLIDLCPGITDKELARAYIGDKVGGEITIANRFNDNKQLDKFKYSKDYLDALTGGEHDMDLTF